MPAADACRRCLPVLLGTKGKSPRLTLMGTRVQHTLHTHLPLALYLLPPRRVTIHDSASRVQWRGARACAHRYRLWVRRTRVDGMHLHILWGSHNEPPSPPPDAL